jgi:hypothetical protein
MNGDKLKLTLLDFLKSLVTNPPLVGVGWVKIEKIKMKMHN